MAVQCGIQIYAPHEVKLCGIGTDADGKKVQKRLCMEASHYGSSTITLNIGEEQITVDATSLMLAVAAISTAKFPIKIHS